MTKSTSIIIMLFMLTRPALGIASGIIIQPGATMSLGNSKVDMGCTDASIIGSLNIQSSTIVNTRHFNIPGGNVNAGNGEVMLSGNWSNTGTFIPGTSQVNIQDGCSTNLSAMTGSTDFHAFSTSTANGKILQIAAGSRQAFDKSLVLHGASGNRLLLRSSRTGSQAFFLLDPAGKQDIFDINVKDNNARDGQTLIPDSAVDFNSQDLGNNINWFLPLTGYAPIPTLSRWALVVLALMLVTTAFRRHRIPSTEESNICGD